jgi:TetR/AcrR family transcriptional repressor of mexJK operon
MKPGAAATKASRRGRHADPDKATAILRAAKRLFPVAGFDRTGMDAIALEANVSKATIYSKFGNKERLFEATLHGLMQDMPTPAVLITQRTGTLPQRLHGIARDTLRIATGPVMAGIHRMLALPMQSARLEPGQFWNAYFQPCHDALRSLLDAEAAAAGLSIPDTARAASHFFGMVAGQPTIHMLIAGQRTLREDEIDLYATTAVELFLRAHVPPG